MRHLGILIGTDVEACRAAMFEAIVGRVQGRVAHWSAKQLTLLGRVYVAKQVLASMLYHHGTYVMPLPRHQRHLENLLVGFVGKGALLARDDSSTRLPPAPRYLCSSLGHGRTAHSGRGGPAAGVAGQGGGALAAAGAPSMEAPHAGLPDGVRRSAPLIPPPLGVGCRNAGLHIPVPAGGATWADAGVRDGLPPAQASPRPSCGWVIGASGAV